MEKIYKFEIPDKMVGLVIGKGTETIKQTLEVPKLNPDFACGVLEKALMRVEQLSGQLVCSLEGRCSPRILPRS